jgi:hypothetical protein
MRSWVQAPLRPHFHFFSFDLLIVCSSYPPSFSTTPARRVLTPGDVTVLPALLQPSEPNLDNSSSGEYSTYLVNLHLRR